MKLVIGGDHRGFDLKNAISSYLKSSGLTVLDVGSLELDHNDDYPIIAEKLAKEVLTDKQSLGILLCGSGVGVEIVANKFDGIRAGMGINDEQVSAARRDDDINVLILAADYIEQEKAFKMVDSFIKTKYVESVNHKRRLDQVASIEKTN